MPRLPRQLLLACAMLSAVALQAAPEAAARRFALLQLRPEAVASLPMLTRALADSDPLVRRTAARLLVAHPQCGASALLAALRNSDPLVRRMVVSALPRLGGAAIAPLQTALSDAEPLVRQAAVIALSALRPRSEAVLQFILQAGQDADSNVRQAAMEASRYYYTVIYEQALPLEGWRFRTDRADLGGREEWFRSDLPETGWDTIEVGRWWDGVKYKDLRIGWYRLNWIAPPKPRAGRFELYFEAVDENAWVWVNGTVAGDHALGTSGWDKPFSLDVSDRIRWDGPNQITVKVVNEVGAGGIYRPVSLRALELQK